MIYVTYSKSHFMTKNFFSLPSVTRWYFVNMQDVRLWLMSLLVHHRIYVLMFSTLFKRLFT